MKARYAKSIAIAVIVSLAPAPGLSAETEKGVKRLLYVTAPDGAMRARAKPGIYIYDIDDGHKFVRHISIPDMGGTAGSTAPVSRPTGRNFTYPRAGGRTPPTAWPFSTARRASSCAGSNSASAAGTIRS